MLTSRPVARSRNIPFGTLVLLLGLGAASALPQDAVWCRGPAHSALESAWSACCTSGFGAGGCNGWSAEPGAGTEAASASVGAERCSDLQLGAPSAVAPPPAPQPAAATHAGAIALLRPDEPARSSPRSLPNTSPPQIRDSIGTTVLTI
ncbi:MAG: hypothetical protein AB1625_07115 [Acidobacteriota bacterium]